MSYEPESVVEPHDFRLRALELHNFLSYRDARLELGDLVALVGPNASGKSNLIAAFRLLSDIVEVDLRTALSRRGGFDALRHRSGGRPYDPSLRLEFDVDGHAGSYYELALKSIRGKRYQVKREAGRVDLGFDWFEFRNDSRGFALHTNDPSSSAVARQRLAATLDQSVVIPLLTFGEPYSVFWRVLSSLQLADIDPGQIRGFQDADPGVRLAPDGSNSASILQDLKGPRRAALVAELQAVVPSIRDLEVASAVDKLAIQFGLAAGETVRYFRGTQMSDGTLRSLGILLAFHQSRRRASLVIIEEPEIRIHMGALRGMVEIFRSYATSQQILMTTHSADIVDALNLDDLRVVWMEDGESHVAPVAAHTVDVLRQGLISAGTLLRSDALDPGTPLRA